MLIILTPLLPPQLAIEAIAKVATERACQGATSTGIGEIVTGKLVELCAVDGGAVSSAAASALKDVLRAHPESRFSVAPVLGRCLRMGGEEKVRVIGGVCTGRRRTWQGLHTATLF